MNERAHAWIAMGLPVVVGALLGCTRLGSLDLPLMLANGEWILTEAAIPRTNVFSWVNDMHPYLNDKWGFMVLVAAVERLGGVAGLAALKMAFGGLLGGLLYVLALRSLPKRAASTAACVAITMLSYRLNLRAEWLSYVFAAVTLLLLPRVGAGDRRATAAQIALMPVWAACHGYWVLGPVLLMAWAVGARSLRTVAVAVGAVAAAAISPFGIDNVLHPLAVLDQLRGPLAASITELRAPFSGGAPFTFFHGLGLVLSVVAAAAAVAEFRARRWAEALVLLALLVVSWRLDRNLALLGLTLPLAAGAGVGLSRALRYGDVVWIAGLVGLSMGADSVAVDRLFGPGEHPSRFPITLLGSLPEEWSGEHYVNDLSLGSWLVRARGEAFIDGNTEGYPPEFLARYRRILEGEERVASVESEFAPDGWFLRTSAAPTRGLVLGLFVDGGSAPAKWDEVATLFRSDLEPEEADRRWREWLHAVYLPRALDWFPSADEARAAARAALPPGAADDELTVLRGAILLQPWSAELYSGMADAYADRGDGRNSARCRRWAHLVTPD